ncbi:MAG: AEC family transporter [Pseudorhodobacter sp.]
MSALLNVILPVFLILGFGYFAAWKGIVSDASIDGIMKFAQNFAIPVLLFRSMSQLELSSAFDPRLLISFYAGAFVAGGLAYLLARRFFDRSPADALVIAFAACYSNSLLLGLPITERAYGSDALSGNYAIITFHSPLLYTIGIFLMEVLRARNGNRGALAREVTRSVLTQPIVSGIIIGLMVNMTGLPLPGVVLDAVDMMAVAAIPAALFGMGGVLIHYRPEGDMRAIAMLCGISLLLHPALTWILARYGFGLDIGQIRSAVVTAAMAPGVNAYLFANMYDAAKRVTASTVLISTGVMIGTVWIWLYLLP